MLGATRGYIEQITGFFAHNHSKSVTDVNPVYRSALHRLLQWVLSSEFFKRVSDQSVRCVYINFFLSIAYGAILFIDLSISSLQSFLGVSKRGWREIGQQFRRMGKDDDLIMLIFVILTINRNLKSFPCRTSILIFTRHSSRASHLRRELRLLPYRQARFGVFAPCEAPMLIPDQMDNQIQPNTGSLKQGIAVTLLLLSGEISRYFTMFKSGN